MEEPRSLESLFFSNSCLVEFFVKNIEDKMMGDPFIECHIRDSNNLNPKDDFQFNCYHLILARIQTIANETFYLEEDPFNLKLLSVVQQTVIERLKERRSDSVKELEKISSKKIGIEEQIAVPF
tara:strand:+ start:1121 stop:1492 length:372 start_codon:yes stop_codon:yes gene_type:complete